MSPRNKSRVYGSIILLGYIGSIVLANWLVQRFGLVPIGFGLLAPAGVFAVGLTFPARDYIQKFMGKAAGIAGILIGAGISWAISPTLAIASGVTFLISETADFLVYTPMQRKFAWAVVISGVISAVVDSLVFLRLAHIPYDVALAGQIVGKIEVILLVGLPTAFFVRKMATAQ